MGVWGVGGGLAAVVATLRPSGPSQTSCRSTGCKDRGEGMRTTPHPPEWAGLSACLCRSERGVIDGAGVTPGPKTIDRGGTRGLRSPLILILFLPGEGGVGGLLQELLPFIKFASGVSISQSMRYYKYCAHNACGIGYPLL